MRRMRYIVLYKQSNRTKSVQLSQALHGYIDYSNGGKYKYRRKGVLDSMQYWNPIKGVYILKNKQDKDKLIEIFERYNAKYYVGEIRFLTENYQQFIHD